MLNNSKVQFNVRLSQETINKLDEIVMYYQEQMKIGKVYKADVLEDIIDKSFEIMQKQKLKQ